MQESFRIARIADIDIRIHWSWFAIFFLLVWSLAEGLFEEELENPATAKAWTAAVVATLLFFASVLLHELSHSLVAKRLGLPVPSITLFIFGGASMLGEEPATPGDEFKIAIVGPLTSVLIAAASAAVFLLALVAGAGNTPVGIIAGWLAFINLVLAIFNMLPGFPLDGGRVLRAAFWARTGSVIKATRWAALGATAISFGLIGLGVINILAGAFIGGVWFIVIGWFLRNAAESSYQQLFLRNAMERIRVKDVVNRDQKAASPDTPLSDVVNHYILEAGLRAVPIAVGDQLLGLISVSDLKRVPADEWRSTSAFKAMTPREKLQTITIHDSLSKAVEVMTGEDVHQLPVLDGHSFVGFVNRADVLRLIQIRSEVGKYAGDEEVSEHRDGARV